VVKNELEQPLPDSLRVDPALVQKAIRASYSSASPVAASGSDVELDSGDTSS
jgi:hypothetical protein